MMTAAVDPMVPRRAADEPSLPWVEKYRPKSMDALVSQDAIVSVLQRFIAENRLPHLLFYGPPGTGKTSTILACAQTIYGPNYKSMILELNASDDRGIDVVREQIKNFASTRKIFSSGFKLIILDEADAMTNAAQAALRRVIEKYTRNVRFCIICNYVSKIIPAVQSRCTSFRFAPLSAEQMKARLDYVIECENVDITLDGRQALLKLANGDMRKVLNVLQAASMAYKHVDGLAVYMTTGQPQPHDISTIIEWMLNESFNSAYQQITELKTLKGLALQDVLREVHGFTKRIVLPTGARMFLLDEMSKIEYRLASGATEKLQLLSLISAFVVARDQITAAA